MNVAKPPFSAERPHGLSLVELLLGLAIFGVVGLIASKQITNLFDASNQLDYELDLIQMANEFRSQVSCSKTLTAAKAANGGSMPVAGSPINILKSNGKDVLGPLGPSGSPFATSRQFGAWYVNAIWTSSGIALSVAKPSGSGFAKLRFNSQVLDFSQPKHQLFQDAPLCSGAKTTSLQIDFVTTTTGQLNPLVGLAATAKAVTVYAQPIAYSKGCYKTCASKGYVSGWFLGASDTQSVVLDESGNPTHYPPTLSQISCRCIR